MLECHSRIQGQYPVYLPAESLFTRKLVQQIHAETLHGGVSLTMAAIREKYWILTLRQIVRSVRSACWGCKRFRALPLTVPPSGPLPTDRTHGGAAFEVIGTDFVGPIYYKTVPETRRESILGDILLQSIKSSTPRAGS